jgi:predicted component of type VI protein secretion system
LLRLAPALCGGDAPGAAVRASTALTHAPQEVERVAPGPDGRLEVLAAMDGLVGAAGVLPNPMREAAARHEDEEPGLDAARLELLGPAVAALLQAAWAAGDPAVAQGGSVAAALDALCGWPADAAPEPGRAAAPARMADLRAFASRLQGGIRGEAGFGEIVAELLGVPASTEPLHGRWGRVPAEAAVRLSRGGHALGRRRWDLAGAILLRVGPCGAEIARALCDAPPGETPLLRRALAELAGHYLHGDVAVRVELLLAPGVGPQLRLGTRGDALAPRLGLAALLGPSAAEEVRIAFWLG